MLVGTGILVGVMAGGSGIVTTYLAENLTATDTTISVVSTEDFLETPVEEYQDFIQIESERIWYTGTTNTTFTGCTRGYDDTEATSHDAGHKVYSRRAANINNTLGFDMVALQDQLGWATILAIPFMFFIRTIPEVIKMSTTLLTGDLAILSWFFYAMVAGFVVTLAMSIIGSRRVA